jgi:hypothetical protein
MAHNIDTIKINISFYNVYKGAKLREGNRKGTIKGEDM